MGVFYQNVKIFIYFFYQKGVGIDEFLEKYDNDVFVGDVVYDD